MAVADRAGREVPPAHHQGRGSSPDANAPRARGTAGFASDALIERASQLSLDAGADFLKTSTGKTPVSATPEAARVMLNAIAADPRHARVGFKASGGIRTVADATLYFGLVEQILGASALTPKRFRIGASGLLNDIEAVLGGRAAPPPAVPGTY